jgi:hypothetical protein
MHLEASISSVQAPGRSANAQGVVPSLETWAVTPYPSLSQSEVPMLVLLSMSTTLASSLKRLRNIYSGWWRFIIHYWCYIYGMFDYQEKSLNYPHRWNWWAFKPNVETILVAIVRAPWPGTALKRLKSTSLEKTKAPSCALIDHQPISTPKKLEFLLENHGEY